MAKFYGVKVGEKIGVYNTWTECLEQVKGYSGADYKSFKTKEEANEFVYGNSISVVKKEHKLDDDTKDEVTWLINEIRNNLTVGNIESANMYLDNIKDALEV